MHAADPGHVYRVGQVWIELLRAVQGPQHGY